MGRYIKETDYQTGVDGCHYPGSPRPPLNGITQPNPILIDNAANKWGDIVGFGKLSIEHYRAANRVPCSATVYQRMKIACNVSTYQSYKDNVLVSTIGVSTITVTRDGVTAGPITY